jgi:protein-disulfide isomerase
VDASENQVLIHDERQKYEWAIEEILQQLKDLRTEVSGVKNDVTALANEVDALAKNPQRTYKTAPVKVDLGSHILGGQNASYAIIEFSDYQCSYCSRHANNVFPQIKNKLIDTGRVKYAMHDFPLGFHGKAKGAAVAVRCAGEQDKFWEMHTELFANQRNLGNDFYEETAKAFALDSQIFSKCLADPAMAKAVDLDIAYGNSLGVTGTPKFFVGRIHGDEITDVIVISGAQSFAAFSGAIERLSN